MARPKNDGRGRLGGRAKGTPNKKTGEIRTFISELLTSNREEIKKAFEELEPKDEVAAFTQLVKYIVPSLQSVDIDAVVDKKRDSVEDKLRDLSEDDTE